MTATTPLIKQALAILGEDPLPADAGARLQALEAQASADELDYFEEIWEGFIVAGGQEADLIA